MKSCFRAVVCLVALLTLAWTTANTTAQDAASPQSLSVETDAGDEHEELRKVREALTKAVIAGDIDTQIQFVHDNVVTTWQNNQVAKGTDGLKQFMEQMRQNGENVFRGYTVEPETDDLAVLYDGPTAIAYGKSIPHYTYLGMNFDLENRWTATLVKQDGQWKIAAYHVSANLADNPFLDAAKRSLVWVGAIAGLIGLILGWVLAKLSSKRARPASA